MSKPQAASEPSMEEILTSIRKMIADDRPGPSPMPDQMGRTPFGEPAVRSSAVSEFSGRAGTNGSAARPAATQPSNFNSLADALKVATGLSEQRRSLQREIADVLERGPRSDAFDPLGQPRGAGASPTARSVTADANGAAGAEKNGPRLPDSPGWRDEPAASSLDAKRAAASLDFGTLVPQRADASAAEGTKPAADAKAEIRADGLLKEEPRVVSIPRGQGGLNGSSHNGTGLNGHHATGLNGASAPAGPGAPSAANGAGVAPLSRSKDGAAGDAEKSADASLGKSEAAHSSPTSPSEASLKADAAAVNAEALLDAVVDLVQQQPGALSVFTSGASFIGGVGRKANEVIASVVASTPPAGSAETPGVPAVPAKLDRAAAELLRPMLRQWLADNMPRIVEEALRSELSDQTQGDGKD